MTENFVDFNIDLSELFEFIDSVERANGLVGYSAPYAIWIEVDTTYTDGKKPPFQPLFEWTKRQITSDPDKAEAIAWRIQDKIFENGIEGVYFMTRTKLAYEQDWVQIAEKYEDSDDPEAPEQFVEELLGEMLDYSMDILEAEDKRDTGELIDSRLTIMGADPNGVIGDDIDIDDPKLPSE